MARQGFKPERIISKLREVEVLLSNWQSIQSSVRQIGVTEQTYYRWRKEYGGMRVDRACKDFCVRDFSGLEVQ